MKMRSFFLSGTSGSVPSIEDISEVDGKGLKGEVILLSVDDSPFGERILPQSVSRLNECFECIDRAVDLVFSRIHHRSVEFRHVGIALEHAIDIHRVTVLHGKASHIELINVVDGIFRPTLSYEPHILAIGIAGKSSGIVDGHGDALVLPHFIEHRSLHLSTQTNERFIGTHLNHVVVLQAYVACEVSIEDEVVEVDGRNLSAVAQHLDVAHGSNVADTASCIECVESGGKGAERISSRHLHLTHHLHLNASGLTHREADL